MSETAKRKSKNDYSMFDGLTDKQIEAAKMLQSGEYTKGEIAEKVGIHPNTMTAWCKNEKFQAAVRMCEREKIRQTLALLSESSVIATRVLLELVRSGDKRVQMEAAKYILDRNLGKTTSKIIVDDSGKDDKDVDIDSALSEFRSGNIAIGESPDDE